MEKDPVCGMSVDALRATAQANHDGKNYFFCSAGCATKFKADPAKYLSQPEAAQGMPEAPIPLGGIQAANQGSSAKGDRWTHNAADKNLRASASEYICPMDPEVHQDRAGACPKCGMALERAAGSAPATQIEYTCPMHPEIVRDAPGSCPICGMALDPRIPVVDHEENPQLVSMARRFWVSA